ncbi:MAG: hypothetical protein JSR99_07110 [Proteobacteria bacterium]|nr:hypothetical protein [Pseudomonadota bacterium]
MTLEELHEIELSLMRTAFQTACEIACLPLNSQDMANSALYSRIATAVQALVERGISDPDVIARRAIASCDDVDADLDERVRRQRIDLISSGSGLN